MAAVVLVLSYVFGSNLRITFKTANDADCAVDDEMLSHEVRIAVSNRPKAKHAAILEVGSQLTVTRNSVSNLLHSPSNENLLKLYRFAMTVSPDTARAERSFSTVKRLLTDYRRSVTRDRLRHPVLPI